MGKKTIDLSIRLPKAQAERVTELGGTFSVGVLRVAALQYAAGHTRSPEKQSLMLLEACYLSDMLAEARTLLDTIKVESSSGLVP